MMTFANFSNEYVITILNFQLRLGSKTFFYAQFLKPKHLIIFSNYVYGTASYVILQVNNLTCYYFNVFVFQRPHLEKV